jgi:hypothetical protein
MFFTPTFAADAPLKSLCERFCGEEDSCTHQRTYDTCFDLCRTTMDFKKCGTIAKKSGLSLKSSHKQLPQVKKTPTKMTKEASSEEFPEEKTMPFKKGASKKKALPFPEEEEGLGGKITGPKKIQKIDFANTPEAQAIRAERQKRREEHEDIFGPSVKEKPVKTKAFPASIKKTAEVKKTPEVKMSRPGSTSDLKKTVPMPEEPKSVPPKAMGNEKIISQIKEELKDVSQLVDQLTSQPQKLCLPQSLAEQVKKEATVSPLGGKQPVKPLVKLTVPQKIPGKEAVSPIEKPSLPQKKGGVISSKTSQKPLIQKGGKKVASKEEETMFGNLFEEEGAEKPTKTKTPLKQASQQKGGQKVPSKKGGQKVAPAEEETMFGNLFDEPTEQPKKKVAKKF